MARLRRARPSYTGARHRGAGWILAVLVVLALGTVLCAPVSAQQYVPRFPAVPAKPAPSRMASQPQMLVKANQINYDNANHLVAAIGNVQIYYRGSTLEADKVIYDQTTKRLHAEGNVRLTEADGTVSSGQIIDLSDNYRDGFIDALHADTAERTFIAAARAERSAGRFNVFHNGVYTACLPCKDDPKKPPEWQVRSKRIVHDQQDKMMYFEDAQFEFWGLPVAYFPYFSAPDPTVKRKTGFLMPTLSSSPSIYGFGVEIPYYFALAPNYDATIAPKITTLQGPLMQAEFRQRLLNGSYEIRAAGIHQLDPEKFTNPYGDRENRGSIESDGKFALNERWTWGWDAILLSDRYFLSDYNPTLSKYYHDPNNLSLTSEGISQLFLTGKGDRSYFDARSIYYLGFSGADVQSQIPIIYPVIDYTYTVDHPVLGGEFSYNTNFTNLTRDQANFDAVTKTALTDGTCTQTADPAIINQGNCALRGFPGTYSRFSAETNWRRSITDSIGQIFTPFVKLRADVASLNVESEPGVSNYLSPGSSELARGMPTVGVEYRYPFISVESWGTQTIQPIAQVIARPDEPQIGKWPNEDAQTLIFDDSNLFRLDKFSGWDRVEGGGRTNYGVQYTMQFNQGGFVDALFGQSYQLFGQNSFAVGGVADTGLGSGLDTTLSDYVARISYRPDNIYTFSSRFRFDKDDFSLRRMELQSTANFDRWQLSVLYGDYAAQPEIGFFDRRQGVLTSGSVKLTANWVLNGGVLYDINAKEVSQSTVGLGYVDDCLALGLNYITSYSYNSGSAVSNQTVLLTLALRTIASNSVGQNVNALNTAGYGSRRANNPLWK